MNEKPSMRTLFSRATMRDIWFLLESVRPMLPFLLGLLLITQLLQLVVPYLFKQIIDTISHMGPDAPTKLFVLIGASFLMTLTVATIRFRRDEQIFELLLRLWRDLPVKAQQKVLDLSLGFHENQDTGATIVRIKRGVERFDEFVANCLFDVIPSLVQTLGTFIFLCVIDWRVALVFFPISPAFIWLTKWINEQVSPIRRELEDLNEQAGSHLAQTLMNMNTVQSYAQQARELARHRSIRQQAYETEGKEWALVLKTSFWRDQLINVGRNLVLLYSVYLLIHGDINLGTLVMFVTVSETAYISHFDLSRIFARGANWAESIRRLAQLLQEPLHVTEKADARPIGPIKGEIEFRNVSFAYSEGQYSLDQVSFHIEPGKTIALVGPSGGGKSTIINLLYRHYDPTSGQVLIDGQPLTELKIASFRTQMAVVTQNVEVFDTIRENIAYGRPDATLDEVVAAAKLAHAHEFIEKLPDGYDSLVGERGIKLSGGQRQRIGIARAILTNPRILVFDEATSNLDSHSERLIQDALRRLRQQRTVIIVAHRLSTIRSADRILVVRDGKIVERGNHAELLQNRNGVYAQYHGLQTEATPSV